MEMYPDDAGKAERREGVEMTERPENGMEIPASNSCKYR